MSWAPQTQASPPSLMRCWNHKIERSSTQSRSRLLQKLRKWNPKQSSSQSQHCLELRKRWWQWRSSGLVSEWLTPPAFLMSTRSLPVWSRSRVCPNWCLRKKWPVTASVSRVATLCGWVHSRELILSMVMTKTSHLSVHKTSQFTGHPLQRETKFLFGKLADCFNHRILNGQRQTSMMIVKEEMKTINWRCKP